MGSRPGREARDRESCATDTFTRVSLVFKSRWTNFIGSHWQTEKQRHWTENSCHFYVLPQEAVENKEVNSTNKRQQDRAQAAQAQCERLIINTCGFILRYLKWP